MRFHISVHMALAGKVIGEAQVVPRKVESKAQVLPSRDVYSDSTAS